jgi:ribosomal protein L30E
MAKKAKISEELKELKLKVQGKKGIVGAERVLKELKSKKLSKVYMASNCPEKISDEINHYSGLAKVPVVTLEMTNEELGIFCKKNFFVSVLGIGE